MSANYRITKSKLVASILITIIFLQATGPFGIRHALADGFGPTPGFIWHPFFCIGTEVCEVGDFNGDDKDDIAAFVRSTQKGEGAGDVWVALSNGQGFDPSSVWHPFFCLNNEVCEVGDFNGDGKDDIAAFVRNTQKGEGVGDVWVALSNGQGFDPSSVWHPFFCVTKEVCAVGDFNGDGKDDIAAFVRSTQEGEGAGDVWVALSNGQGFEPSSVWYPFFCVAKEVCEVGDFNGDGRDDIAAFVRHTQKGEGIGDVWVALSNGQGFDPSSVWHTFFCIREAVCATGDFDGDGRDDIAAFVRHTQRGEGIGDVWVALSNGQGFELGSIWHQYFCVLSEVCGVGNFDGDEKDDLVTFVRDESPKRRGYVYVALADQPSLPEPRGRAAKFGYGRLKVNGTPASGARPLLVVLVDYPDSTLDFYSPGEYERLIFGPDEPNVANYLLDTSYGHFTWAKTAIVGPAFAEVPTKASEKAKFIAANNGFNFADYDTNHDGKVRTDELSILVIDNITADGGIAEPYEECLAVGDIQVCSAVAYVGVKPALNLIAHELSHLLGAVDLYGVWNVECLSDRLTLMSCSGGADDRTSFHFDPWYKIQFGWVRPKIYRLTDPGTCTTLSAPQLWRTEASQPIILYDPKKGLREYFLLEYRSSMTPLGGGYDANVADQGVAVWYVQTDGDGNLVELTFPDGKRNLNFNVGSPNGGRGHNTLWKDHHGEVGLQLLFDKWVYDGTDGLKMQVGPVYPDQAHVDVEWAYFGGPLMPRLGHVTETPELGVFETHGMFGVNQGNRVVSLLGNDTTYDVQIEKWGCNTLRFSVPPGPPPGDYQLVIYDDASRTTMSNRVPITVRYHTSPGPIKP